MANGNFGGGSGTKLSPYLVEDAFDLNAVRHKVSKDYYYRQTRDIDLSGWNWEPIQDFFAHYDGGNFLITNMKIEKHFKFGDSIPLNATRVGLFGRCDGVNEYSERINGRTKYYNSIRNIHLVNFNIDVSIDYNIIGNYNLCVGGIAGQGRHLSGCTVKSGVINCTIKDKGTIESVGGFVGKGLPPSGLANGTFFECGAESVDINVIGSNLTEVGGFVGKYAQYDQFESCYATGKITGAARFVGGFAGKEDPLTTRIDGFIRCYCAVNLSKVESIDISEKDLIGVKIAPFLATSRNYSGTSNLLNCYYDSDVSKIKDDEIGLPRPTNLMKKQSTFETWDFANTWRIIEDKTYPFFGYAPSTGICKSMPFPLKFRKMTVN